MKTYTCKTKDMQDLLRFFVDDISGKLERLVEESHFEKYVIKVDLWDIPQSYSNPDRTDTRVVAKVKAYEAYHILWMSFKRDSLTEVWKALLQYDICPPGRFGSDDRISLEGYFQDILNPAEIELEEFEMLTGNPYMLSSKFFEGLSSGQPFDVVARSVPEEIN